MITKKQALTSWLWLMVLTTLSVCVGALNINRYFLVALVMLTVVLKGQQITDIFMELIHAPKKWRMLLLSYVIIIPVLICVIYVL